MRRVRRATISLPSVDSSGMQAIVATATTSGKRTTSAPTDASGARESQDDEAELAAGSEQQSGLQRRSSQRNPKRARKAGDDGEP